MPRTTGDQSLRPVRLHGYVGVLPSIVPVNYLLDDDKVVIRTDAGSKLAAALRGAPVAFEVDGVDETHQAGWSVVVRGHAEEVTDAGKLAELRQTPLLAWHPGPKSHYVRINASQVIGRLIRIADLPGIGGDDGACRCRCNARHKLTKDRDIISGLDHSTSSKPLSAPPRQAKATGWPLRAVH